MNDTGFRMLQLFGKGYCCSQILMILALEMQGKENPDLVRAMAGLCMGGGNTGGICGVFSGAASVLALYAGKGGDNERQADRLPLMYSELSDWFTQSACSGYAGTSCSDIAGEGAARPHPDRCGRLLVDTWGYILEILVENGFDPVSPGNG